MPGKALAERDNTATDCSCTSSPPAPRILTAGLQPRAPHQLHLKDLPMEVFFLPSCTPTNQAAPKTSLPLLSPCWDSLCKGDHSFPCSPYDLGPTHLPPTSQHLSSSQLSCLAGRRAIRVHTPRQHHVNAEGWGGEVQSVSCGSFKPKAKEEGAFLLKAFAFSSLSPTEPSKGASVLLSMSYFWATMS